MKTIITSILLLVAFGTNAQPNHEKHRKPHPEFTSEQQKTLRLKEMTLALDLSASQQKEMATLIDEQFTAREAKREQMKALNASDKKPTADQIFEQKNKTLDQRIAFNEKARKFLDKDQYEKWKQIQHKAKRDKKDGAEFERRSRKG